MSCHNFKQFLYLKMVCQIQHRKKYECIFLLWYVMHRLMYLLYFLIILKNNTLCYANYSTSCSKILECYKNSNRTLFWNIWEFDLNYYIYLRIDFEHFLSAGISFKLQYRMRRPYICRFVQKQPQYIFHKILQTIHRYLYWLFRKILGETIEIYWNSSFDIDKLRNGII